jgi:hypothetical protein
MVLSVENFSKNLDYFSNPLNIIEKNDLTFQDTAFILKGYKGFFDSLILFQYMERM